MDPFFAWDSCRTLDSKVRDRLVTWPQRPPGLPRSARSREAWLRARPGESTAFCHPFLKLPGSRRHRTLPDGLWLNFGGSSAEPFVDIFCIEACGTLQNLLDKRSRFAPTTGSLMAVCPLPWLLGAVMSKDPTPRWQLTGVLREAPTQDLVMPVRDLRVIYGLKLRHYQGFGQHQVPQAHEFFMPMEALLAEDGDKDPALQALVGRATAAANFFD